MPEPAAIASWTYGANACGAALLALRAGGTALDAAEAGATAVELDPTVDSVGYGGLPNADGIVEVDAAIMDGRTHDAGAVVAVTGVKTPTSLARMVMERTRHTMLAGDNAKAFALRQGFREEALLTDTARAKWEEWRAGRGTATAGHDTVGICVQDSHGDLAAACTTSGLRWKIPGRVGDTAIVGSGLYVDNKVGAATATGDGDFILRTGLCYRVVCLMERGLSPNEACEEALLHLLEKCGNEVFAACVALGADGSFGEAATPGTAGASGGWHFAYTEGDEARCGQGHYVQAIR